MSNIRLIQGDCLEVMDRLIEEGVKIDLTVTSPPYDDLRNYNNSLEWNFDIFKQIANRLYNITIDGGIVVWIVGDKTHKGSETGTSFKQALYFKEIGFKLHDTMIYQKDNPPPVGGSNRYYQHFEYMFILVKGKLKTFNPIMTERRNKYNDKRTHRFKGFTRNKDGEFEKKLVKLNTTVKIGNIWRYIVSGGSSSSDKIAYKHPAIFPEKLALDHIVTWTDELDLVFDPMMGSGTVGKMAIRNKRNFIGIEKVENYFKIATERIENEGNQISLF